MSELKHHYTSLLRKTSNYLTTDILYYSPVSNTSMSKCSPFRKATMKQHRIIRPILL